MRNPLLAALCTLVLAACQTTALENLPVGATAECPPEWAGAWIGLDADSGAPEDAGFMVTPDCATTMVETHQGKRRETRFSPRFASAGGTNLVFVGPEDAAKLFEGAPPERAGWYPYAWRRSGDVMALRPPDHRRIATLIVNGAIEGTTTWNRNDGENFVFGDAQAIAAALRGPVGFRDEPGFRLRRVGDTRRDLDRAIDRATRSASQRPERARRKQDRP